MIFTDTYLYAGVGRPYGKFRNFRYMYPTGLPASTSPGFDRYGQYNSSFLYQQTRRDRFPVIVMSSSGSFCVATSSDHSSQSQTHSRLFEHDSKPPIKAQSANNERVESPFRNCDSDIQGLGHSNSGHVHHSPQFPPSSVHVSNSGATSTGGRCSVSGLAGEVNVHVSAVSLAQQSHSESMCHPGGRSDPDSPLVAITRGLVLLFILAPSSCARTRNLIKSTIPGIYLSGPSGKSEFGAPYCPVRALH